MTPALEYPIQRPPVRYETHIFRLRGLTRHSVLVWLCGAGAADECKATIVGDGLAVIRIAMPMIYRCRG